MKSVSSAVWEIKWTHLSFGCSKNHGLHRLNRWSLSSTWWFQAAITQIPCSTLRRCWQTSWQNDTRKLRSLSPGIGVIIWTSLIWTDERRKKNLLNLCNLWYWRTNESWISYNWSSLIILIQIGNETIATLQDSRCKNKTESVEIVFIFCQKVFNTVQNLLPIYHNPSKTSMFCSVIRPVSIYKRKQKAQSAQFTTSSSFPLSLPVGAVEWRNNVHSRRS